MKKKETRVVVIPEKYLAMIKNNRMTSGVILDRLAAVGILMTDRQWRAFVRQYNDKYGSRDRYIASNSQGYILTVKKDPIKQSALNKIRTGVAMIRNGKATLDELSQKKQLSLLPDEADLYDLAMTVDEE